MNSQISFPRISPSNYISLFFVSFTLLAGYTCLHVAAIISRSPSLTAYLSKECPYNVNIANQEGLLILDELFSELFETNCELESDADHIMNLQLVAVEIISG